MSEKNESRTLKNGETRAESLIALHQRNLDELHRSITTTLDDVHAIASRNWDLTMDAHRQLALLLWRQPVPARLDDGVSAGLDLAKCALETSFAQAAALADVAAKAQRDALTILGRSVCDSLDGLKPNGAPAEK